MLAILVTYHDAFLSGALVTLALALVIWTIGLLAGVPLGAFRASLRGHKETAVSLVFLALGSVPVLVYLFWLHYPAQQILHLVINPFYTSCVALGFTNALAVSEVFRGAIVDFPAEYWEVARVNGVSQAKFWRTVKAPLILITVLPAYIATQVAALHSTLFASVISVNELFREAQRINAVEYNPIAVYSLLVIFYFLLSFPLLLLSRWLNAKYGSWRERT